MEYETVFFSENVALLATLGYPDAGEGPFPAIVLLHGHARHRNDGLDALSHRLNEAGFITLRFNFRGCGETMYERYNIICHTRCPEDAFNAVSFLMTRPRVDAQRIGIAGESLGASTAIYAAGTDSRIKCAVSMAGLGDPERNLRSHLDRRYGSDRFGKLLELIERDRYQRVCTGHSEWLLSTAIGDSSQEEADMIVCENTLDHTWGSANSNYMTVASLESLLKYKPLHVCARITQPILFLHGSEDTVVDAQEGREMCAYVSSAIKEFRLLQGIDHNMPLHKKRDEVFECVTGWFSRYL